MDATHDRPIHRARDHHAVRRTRCHSVTLRNGLDFFGFFLHSESEPQHRRSAFVHDPHHRIDEWQKPHFSRRHSGFLHFATNRRRVMSAACAVVKHR